jgi:RNA polymerase sigma-70 factor (ECF subfamily)
MESWENQIFKELNLGNKETFQFIFNKYYLGLYYYAKKITGNKENAEEAVQNTFLKLWEKPETLNIEKSLDSYLYKAVYNNCLNLLKQLQVKEKYTDNYRRRIQDAEDLYQITAENGQAILIADELHEKIESSISKLPKQCKEIFNLSRKEGLKNKEIAEKLEISLNTVTKQISIALGRLRKSLKQYLNYLI